MKSAKLFFVLILFCNAAMVSSCGYANYDSNTVSDGTQNESSNSGIDDSEAYIEEGNNLVNSNNQEEQYNYGYRNDGVRYIGDRIVLDNSIPFIYDTQSELTVDSFNELTQPGVSIPLSTLERAYPIATAHINHDTLYMVYSLKDGKQAYVIISFLPYTGISYLVTDIVEYPYTSPEQEQKMWFLLPQDLPENILGNSQ